MNRSVIDMHVHLWGHNAQEDERALGAMLDRYDIGWLSVIPLWGGRFPARSETLAGNAAARFCRRDAARCKAYVTVNPRHGPAARDDIRRGIEENGAVAVKIWVAARAEDPLSAFGGNHLWGCAHIASCANVWSDFSGTYCETGALETAVHLLGEDRVLFGSDAPGADFRGNLAKLEEAALTEPQRAKIRRGNAARLFKTARAS